MRSMARTSGGTRCIGGLLSNPGAGTARAGVPQGHAAAARGTPRGGRGGILAGTERIAAGAAPASVTNRYIGGGRTQEESEGGLRALAASGPPPPATPVRVFPRPRSTALPSADVAGAARSRRCGRSGNRAQPAGPVPPGLAPSEAERPGRGPGARPAQGRGPDQGRPRWPASVEPGAPRGPVPNGRRSGTSSPTEPRGFVASVPGPSGAGGFALLGSGAHADNPLGILAVSARGAASW